MSTGGFVMGMVWDEIKRVFNTYEQSKALQIILVTAFTMLYIVYKYISLVSDAESIAGISKNYILTGLALVMVPVFVLVIATITSYCKWTVNATSDNLGKISYEIYLYHGLIAMLLVTGISNELLKVLLIVAVTLITAFVMNLLHRRLKALYGK
jgi:peptidoglycan/LPS O-acetylase OafA/YrhL